MFRINGINGESIVVDGNWVEKLLTVPAERRAEVDALIAELDKARAGIVLSASVWSCVQGQAEEEIGHA